MKTRSKTVKIAGFVLLAVLIIYIIASLIAVPVLFHQTFERTVPREEGLTAYLRYWDVEDQYPREAVSFLSGKNRLYGHLYGVGNPEGLVVISHGMGGGEESYLAEALFFVDHGYQVLCYSNTGCWDSEGRDCVGLNQSVLDLDAALDWVERDSRFGGVPVFLYGHSWGGYAVAAIFHFGHEEIAASVSVAGFDRAMPMIVEWGRDMLGPLIYAEAPFIWLNQKLTFGNTFSLSAVDAINSTDTPVLIIHGNADTTVGFNTVSIISQKNRFTNPNVSCFVCDQPEQNDHNNLFQSLDSIAYHDEMNKVYKEIYDQYGGEIPEDVEREFYAGTDPFLTSKLDDQFMNRVLAFYRDAVK